MRRVAMQHNDCSPMESLSLSHLFRLAGVLAIVSLLCVSGLSAQSGTGSVHGQVTDPSGESVPDATVQVTGPTGQPSTAKSGRDGSYEVKGLAPGKYTVKADAKGFQEFQSAEIDVAAGQATKLDVALTIEVEQEKVEVTAEGGAQLSVDPGSNAGAIVLSGKDLDELSDDPDQLQSDLQALAGPSVGPNGGQMYIDGFTAGQLPPKSSIREIRINQNPFSSEYDKLGYGRIEIFTKPGTDKLHGQFMVNGNDSAFNSSDPFTGPEPGYDSVQYNGNIGGALNKNGSFFFNVDRRQINALSAIDAVTLDQNLSPFNTLESVPFPQQRTNIGPRLDYALSKNNTLTARYQYFRDTETNAGIGQNALASQATNTIETESTFQIGDTQVYGSKVVNETRFQYLRDNSGTTSLDLNPQTTVLGAFTGGGNGTVSSDHEDHYEFQNYTSVIHGNHTMKFGGRLRVLRDANSSTAGFNGTFTFSSLCSQDTFPGSSSCVDQAPGPGMYQYAEQLLQGGATNAPATQLVITQGSANAGVTTADVGLYVQDDWRIKPNITFSYGLRFESQNDISDHADLAPRLGIAWGVRGRSAPPIIVIRGGLGIFYDRFMESQILQAERLNGITQTQSVINNPTCFPGLDKPLNTPLNNCGTVSSSSSAIYQISPSLTAPYTLQGAISAERQVTKSATLSLTYLTSRGFDQLLTINANAPAPGTPCAPNCVGPAQNLYRYVSEANFRQNQLIVNSNIRWGTRVQLFTYYTLNYANSDTSGVGSFPSNSYDISQDYGRSTFDIRHRLFLGGSIAMKYGFRFSPFLIASSGSPINVTTATDLNGDSIFNDRPGLVSTSTCPTSTQQAPGSSIYCTPLGTFDAMPTSSEKIAPINFATSPSHVSLNFRLAKTFGFGPKLKGTGNLGQGGGPGGGGGGGRRRGRGLGGRRCGGGRAE